MRVSIVIPTYNRAWIFPQILPALLNQNTGEHSYEIIFVANGSTDKTDAILTELAAKHPDRVRYFWIEPTGGPSAPRNVGIRAATGDIVVITDDDVAPDADFVFHHAEFHKRHPAAHDAAVGQVYVPERLMEDPMSLFHQHYSYDRFQNLKRLSFFDFWTCNVSFKRQFMLDHGMFNERFLSMEDIEVAHRLERAGMHLHYLPEAQGQHLHESNPASLQAKAFAFGLWMYHLTQAVPAGLVKRRFGLVTTEFGIGWFVKRILRLAVFVLFDNPLTRFVLRLLGGTGEKRSRWTDIYYGLVFHRAFLLGYYRSAFRAWMLSHRTG